MAKGDGAEVALLNWVVAHTWDLIGTFGDPARRLLLSAFPSSGQTRRIAEQALDDVNGRDLLRNALWVSRCWRGSGFDIVGLDLRDAKLIVRRYEVKALPEQANVRLFVSSNELAVYRATRAPATATRADLRTGTWDLVGVRPKGQAWMLTNALAPVLDPAAGGLGLLRGEGFAPDDLQLVLRLEDDPDLVTPPPAPPPTPPTT